MTPPLLEFEGTWEEIKTQMPAFANQRLHVTVRTIAEPSPLDAALAEVWEQVPEEAWQQFPADFAENMDAYLYGTPKR